MRASYGAVAKKAVMLTFKIFNPATYETHLIATIFKKLGGILKCFSLKKSGTY